LAAAGKFPRFFFNRFFELPLLRNAPKRIKKKSSKTTKGGKKKTEEKKAVFFVMSPDGFFRKKVLIAFLNSPCHD
jgi:hypothetical protein